MKWLNRDLIVGPYLGLATTEADFHKAMKHCRVPRDDWPKWVSDGADATTHHLKNPEGNRVCIVTVRVKEQEPIQVAAMLVHEAVHVWQEHCDSIGEREPSREFEAYSIQAITQRLLYAYAETLK